MKVDPDFVTNLYATDPETVTAALAQARQWVAEKDPRAQPEQLQALLAGLKAIIEQQERFDGQLRGEAADLLVRQLRNRTVIETIPALRDMVAWYDEQMNYDDVVLNKAADVMIEAINEAQAPILAGLRSSDPDQIRQALAQAEHWLSYNPAVGSPPVFGPILLALKDIVDHAAHLNESVVAEARALMFKELWLNRYLVGDYSPELVALFDWYRTTDEYKRQKAREGRRTAK